MYTDSYPIKKRDVGITKTKQKPKTQRKLMIAFQVIWTTFSPEKNRIQKYPPSPRLGQIIVEHRSATKYSADFYQYRTRITDIIPITDWEKPSDCAALDKILTKVVDM